MSNPAEYSANGKLMLAGEYLVLAGACALALPLRYGQSMQVKPVREDLLYWKSSGPSGKWFEAKYDKRSLEIISASLPETARVLQSWLTAVRELKPGFFHAGSGVSVTVTANYPLQWGWGSSATLLSMLAEWSNSDPFELHHLVSRGSGFDIACARNHRLLFYQLSEDRPMVSLTFPGKALKENTWFCYLGSTRKTEEEVHAFRSAIYTSRDIAEVSDLSVMICNASSGKELTELVRQHEILVGKILKKDPIGRLYPSFPGSVKSLGAWGGDFAMFVSSADPADVIRELRKTGFNQIFRYKEISIES